MFSKTIYQKLFKYIIAKNYCTHTGVGVVAQMLKFFVKVSLYLFNMWIDLVDTCTLHVVRFWSANKCCTIMTHLCELDVSKFYFRDFD